MTCRCTGHCCRVFVLPYAPDEIWDKQDTLRDGRIIADMVIYLGYEPHRDIFIRHGLTPHKYYDDDPRHWYTCRHYKDGDCTIYAQRPTMCRAFPYGKDCEYSDCTAVDIPEMKRDMYNDDVPLLVSIAADHFQALG